MIRILQQQEAKQGKSAVESATEVLKDFYEKTAAKPALLEVRN